MSLKTILISGPPGSGKTAVAHRLAGLLGPELPRYIRFQRQSTAGSPPMVMQVAMSGMADARRCYYSSETLFEVIPHLLGPTVEPKPGSFWLLEADTDPGFRLAYRYELRVFVFACPAHVTDVFRSTTETRDALMTVMNDTGAFASEVFGMERVAGLDDSGSLGTIGTPRRPLDSDDVEHILSTSLGAEIVARMRLQPGYHSIVESDVVILNSAVGGRGEAADLCARRIERLLATLPASPQTAPRFFCCDPLDDRDPLSRRFLQLIGERLRNSAAA